MHNAYAQIDIESAMDAVKNIKVGWNLGNTLESNSGDTLNMWMEWNKAPIPTEKYETGWGQKVTTRELIHMFKEAGFNAIRVPVTWYPHMGITCKTVSVKENGETKYKRYWYRSQWTGTEVDATWMARVKEVVDYVIDEGMYCILNVHHDTGSSNTAWLRANMTTYNKEKDRYEALWTQIATEFKDYDGKLLFEGYNEMLDGYSSWCFASFATSSHYDSTSAEDSYEAINSYAQSFVNAVRATGGNNSTRNLICNTYGGCCGEGTWNKHLSDPLTQMKKPTDSATDHILLEVHSYPSLKNGLASAKKAVDQLMSTLATNIATKAPIIIGEWGTANDGASNDDYIDCKANKLAFAKYFVQQAKAKNYATFYWMGMSSGDSRTVPEFDQPELKDAIITGYYGEGGYVNAIKEITLPSSAVSTADKTYNIAGQLVNRAYKGIVIRNGRKYCK